MRFTVGWPPYLKGEKEREERVVTPHAHAVRPICTAHPSLRSSPRTVIHVVIRGVVVVVRVVLAVVIPPVVRPFFQGVVARLGVVHVGVVDFSVGAVVVVVVLVCTKGFAGDESVRGV